MFVNAYVSTNGLQISPRCTLSELDAPSNIAEVIPLGDLAMRVEIAILSAFEAACVTLRAFFSNLPAQREQSKEIRLGRQLDVAPEAVLNLADDLIAKLGILTNGEAGSEIVRIAGHRAELGLTDR